MEEKRKFIEGKFEDGNGNVIKIEDIEDFLEGIRNQLIIRTINNELYALDRNRIISKECKECGFAALEINSMSFKRQILDSTCTYCGAKWQFCLICADMEHTLYGHDHYGIVQLDSN